MPFTLSHAAAALPFRRTRLIMSALVVGCMAPDFEYFIPFAHHSAFGHTFPGVFLFDLPFSLVVLWLYHRFAKEPLAACLPQSARKRLHLGPRSLNIHSISQLVLLVFSILVGVATHLLWDSFTHDGYWLTGRWQFLIEQVDVPVFGPRPWYGIFQYFSSAFGLFVILLWFLHWYRETQPVHPPPDRRTVIGDRVALACAFTTALILGLLRAAQFGLPDGVDGLQRFMTKTAVTAISVFSIELLLYGIVRTFRRGSMNTA